MTKNFTAQTIDKSLLSKDWSGLITLPGGSFREQATQAVPEAPTKKSEPPPDTTSPPLPVGPLKRDDKPLVLPGKEHEACPLPLRPEDWDKSF